MITFFGASVTLQKSGYAQVLKNMFEEEVIVFGYGGMHLNNAGICFIDEVLDTNPSYCFVDFFSTVYVERTELTKEYLDTIVYKFSKSHCKLIFLFFPKKDNELEKWYSFCKNYLDEKNLFYIDINSKLKNEQNQYLKDIVHTNDKGSKVYAEIIYDKFNQMKNLIKIPNKLTKTKYTDIKKLEVEKLFTDTIMLEGNAEIVGMISTIGPYSGIVEIKTDENDLIKMNIWDEWCYYTREHFNLSFSMKNNAEIKILADIFDTTKCKYDLNFNKKKKKIVLHAIYYIGKEMKIINIKDGKYIYKLILFFLNVKGRIIQLVSKYLKRFIK